MIPTFKCATIPGARTVLACCLMAQFGCAPGTASHTAVASPHSPNSSSSHQAQPYANDDWWPNRLDLRVLKPTAPKGDPVDADFDYAQAFLALDLAAVKQDIASTLTDSKDFWPADWGHYGGLMIRLAWHSSGTYRATDGRGGAGFGAIRFAPLNSWPDNANLDKARRILWPVKKKYGRSLSWADLMILTGNVAFESMGFETFGFGGGREDIYEPTDIHWGPETTWFGDERFSQDGSKLKHPLAASQMGLIYVNPEGPGGKPDPKAAAHHIRLTFGRMGMNDEETVALIAGGHTMGKAHGAAKAHQYVGAEPEAAPLQAQGLGWKNTYRSGKGADTITSGLEGAWTSTPTAWSHGYFQNLFDHTWVLGKSPGGAYQWSPKDAPASVPDAHQAGQYHKPMMLTTDLALKVDPIYGSISKRFYENPAAFNKAFAKAWYKLTHRDMGPHARLLGSEVPEAQIWQDPTPAPSSKQITAQDAANLKRQILKSEMSVAQMVRAAWASASTYRDTDKRGGANGARVRLAPQKDWAINQPQELAKVIEHLTRIQTDFNKKSAKRAKVSLADLIVLAGNAAIESAAKKAGHTLEIPFQPGRTDASQEMTDVASFAYLKPQNDAFRNHATTHNPQEMLQSFIERAEMLTLTAPEMTVLLGGMRTLNANTQGSPHGVLTDRPETLSNDFFVKLLDIRTVWKKSEQDAHIYEGRDRKTGEIKHTATAVDLVFGANAQLRAIAEVYAADDAQKRFVQDFAQAWHKVMQLGRFDLR